MQPGELWLCNSKTQNGRIKDSGRENFSWPFSHAAGRIVVEALYFQKTEIIFEKSIDFVHYYMV